MTPLEPDTRAYTDAVPFPDTVQAVAIGRVHSPFQQRHGTPRQPGTLAGKESGEGRGWLELFPHVVDPLALADLEGFDWLWVVSWFHLNGSRRRPLVRPPRGGPKRGVFSTRAPHRPNPIGLSAVRILSVSRGRVDVAGLDLLDGTPILDLKPYIADYDSRPDASRGWLEDTPAPTLSIEDPT